MNRINLWICRSMKWTLLLLLFIINQHYFDMWWMWLFNSHDYGDDNNNNNNRNSKMLGGDIINHATIFVLIQWFRLRWRSYEDFLFLHYKNFLFIKTIHFLYPKIFLCYFLLMPKWDVIKFKTGYEWFQWRFGGL